MKKILITGKDSYVGTSVKKYLEKWPEEYIVDELDVRGDMWKKYDFSKYDVVFNVAGIAHINNIKNNEETKKLYFSVNTNLAIEIAKKAKKEKISQFIQMSSMSVYGDSAPIGKEKIINKNTKPNPTNFYGQSKLEADNRLEKLASKDFRIAFVRPPMIYGKNCKGNYSTLRKIALKMPFFPKINNDRSMIYIDNFSEFIKEIIDNKDAGLFMPSNAETVSTSKIVETIAVTNNKRIVMIPGLYLPIKLLCKFHRLANKAFGNISYATNATEYNDNKYQKVSTLKSIEMIEGRHE